MISDKYKTIFIHIPRTAGTSIEFALGKSDSKNKHRIVKSYIEIYGEEKWNKYFTFTFIRNPWDKMVSHYHQGYYNDNVRTTPIGIITKKGFKYFLENYKQAPWEPDPLTFKNILEVPEGYKPLDFIGRFENLKEDFTKVCEKIGLKDKLKCINGNIKSRKHKHYSEYYNEETKQMVYEMYKWDIETFDYKFSIK